MKEYEDLSLEERTLYHQQISEAMKPIEDIGVVIKRDTHGLDYWGTTVNPSELEKAVKASLNKLGKDTDCIFINGQKVLLTIAPLLFHLLSENDPQAVQKLKEFIEVNT